MLVFVFQHQASASILAAAVASSSCARDSMHFLWPVKSYGGVCSPVMSTRPATESTNAEQMGRILPEHKFSVGCHYGIREHFPKYAVIRRAKR